MEIATVKHILSKKIEERCIKTDIEVKLAIEQSVGAEGFTITDESDGSIRIAGGDERGLLYGVGKYLRSSHNWRGASSPKLPVRGIYFATHFHNFYHEAPLEAVQNYIEELALWGVNSLAVWFDMHHFNSMNDPNARAMIKRLHEIFRTAKSVGMDCTLLFIVNESYLDSPQEMRAKGPGRGGFYGNELCPSTLEARELILRQFEQLFDEFSDVKIDNIGIWPYDQGSCSCEKCMPWGSNGFLKIAKELAALARHKFPGVEVILSTWYFDSEEWQGLAKAFEQTPDWVNYIMSEADTYAFTHSSPGKLPIVGFPEISMRAMWPWGGFGANPMPQYCQEYWNSFKAKSLGGFPYSEGIYEDINKVTFAGFYWDPDRPVDDILREYIGYEYSPEVVDEVMGVIKILEQNHHMRWWPGLLEGYTGWFPSKDVAPQDDPGAEEAFETVKRIDAKLTEQARKSWRWRILYLRALLDAELKKNGGRPNELCEQAFRELTDISHVENGTTDVKPPSTKIAQ